MKARMNYYKASPAAMKAMMVCEETIKQLSISPALKELINMRVSQINGCAYCLDIHAPEARAAGVSQQKLDVLAAWRESPVFDEAERAALGWAEALTKVAIAAVPDADYEALAEAFSESERAELTFVVTTINAWNRFAVGFSAQHPVRE